MIRKLEANKLMHGDILHCYSSGFLGKAIQWFTKSRINHTAIVLKINNVTLIADSQANGTNLKTLENWKKKYSYNYMIHRRKVMGAATRAHITRKVFSRMGITGYDFASLLIWQPWYIISGRWKGKKKKEAEKRMYCSEFAAWVYDVPGWWEKSPQALMDHLNESYHFNLL